MAIPATAMMDAMVTAQRAADQARKAPPCCLARYHSSSTHASQPLPLPSAVVTE